MVAFSLLQHLWRRHSTGPLPAIGTGHFGKPGFVTRHDLHFNWSHHAAMCVCALSTRPVGVDIQARVPFRAALFDRIAADSEHRLRDRMTAADDLSPLWTRKEAVLKRTGRGTTTALRDIDTVTDDDIVTFTNPEPDFHLSLTVAGLDSGTVLDGLRITWLRPTDTTDLWVPDPDRPALRQWCP